MSNTEGALRKRLRRQGYALRKDRRPSSRDVDHQGGYMILDVSTSNSGHLIAGEHFDLTLAEAIAFAAEK